MSSDEHRTPIVTVLGHVDHGKTTLLDRVRGSTVTEQEAGAITQHIGATTVPLSAVAREAETVVDEDDFTLPGLLFIDTPGHHAFSSLRSRGGALADLAILVVDITDGLQPQTDEALNILADTGTPFVVAANKVDTIPGWSSNAEQSVAKTVQQQSDSVTERFNESLYELIGALAEYDLNADAFWNVDNFRETIGIVPTSATNGDGIGDLLAVLMGLSQRYMQEQMEIDTDGPAIGTVIERNEQRGFGTTLDVLVHDGTLSTDDTIVVGGRNGAVVTDVRQLLTPDGAEDTRTSDAFNRVHSVTAAAGVRVAAPSLEDVLAGAPLRSVPADGTVDETASRVQAEMREPDITTDNDGIVVKADTIGSLEAVVSILREADYPIMRASVGDIAPVDVTTASTANEAESQVVLGFGVECLDAATAEARDAGVEMFTDDIVYQLVQTYDEHVADIRRKQQAETLETLPRPAKITVLRDHVFNQSNPAIVGVEVTAGTLRRGSRVVRQTTKNEVHIGQVTNIKENGEDVDEAEEGDRVSISIADATVGRDFNEGKELWVQLSEETAKTLESELYDELNASEQAVLDTYLEKKRQSNPFWAK